MTPRQSFKAAFLHRCADEGLSLEETHARVKQALFGMGGPGTGLVLGGAGGASAGGPGGAVVGGLAGHAYDKDPTGTAKLLGLAALGIPIGVGVLGGKMLAEAKKDPLTVDEARTNEELAELQRLTDRANRVRQLRTPGATVR